MDKNYEDLLAPALTPFEYAKVIGMRAHALAFGSPSTLPFHEIMGKDSIEIAKLEFTAKKLPVILTQKRGSLMVDPNLIS